MTSRTCSCEQEEEEEEEDLTYLKFIHTTAMPEWLAPFGNYMDYVTAEHERGNTNVTSAEVRAVFIQPDPVFDPCLRS